MKIAGILLAAGLSRRMGGGDKSLRLLGGPPILSRIIGPVAPPLPTLPPPRGRQLRAAPLRPLFDPQPPGGEGGGGADGCWGAAPGVRARRPAGDPPTHRQPAEEPAVGLAEDAAGIDPRSIESGKRVL